MRGPHLAHRLAQRFGKDGGEGGAVEDEALASPGVGVQGAHVQAEIVEAIEPGAEVGRGLGGQAEDPLGGLVRRGERDSVRIDRREQPVEADDVLEGPERQLRWIDEDRRENPADRRRAVRTAAGRLDRGRRPARTGSA